MPKTASAKKRRAKKRSGQIIVGILFLLAAMLLAWMQTREQPQGETVTLAGIPPYSGEAYVIVNDNVPFFTQDEITTDTFETYSPLDELGRCGVAYANVCKELMPTEPRGEIGSVKPSGWHTVRYNGLVEGNYLYNRCHLIGYQLAGENANRQNLITGTRYLNTTGMLPFENQVNDYVDETDCHVLYRVTPIFDGDNLVASGVLMEAYSVEDGGGLAFCVYCYNVQPYITIDYATGESHLSEDAPSVTVDESAAQDKSDDADTQEASDDADAQQTVYVSESGAKYHREDCRYVDEDSHALEESAAQDAGYEPCGTCKP